jgi:hypothetical protein
LKGSAGEHYVAYKLSAMGYIVALPRAGVPSLDLIVATPDGQKTLAIQVKTASQAFHLAKKKPEDTRWYWRVSDKVIASSAESLFYVFVDLHVDDPSKQPDVFIVRSIDIKEENLDPTNGPWFLIMKDDEEKKWHKNDWHLIEEYLPLPKE